MIVLSNVLGCALCDLSRPPDAGRASRDDYSLLAVGPCLPCDRLNTSKL